MSKEKEVEVKKEDKKEVEAVSATVKWNGKERTYTKKLHGENFIALAEEFAGKFKGVVTVV